MCGVVGVERCCFKCRGWLPSDRIRNQARATVESYITPANTTGYNDIFLAS